MTMLIVAIFIVGYLVIAGEHAVGVNKAATALITGVVCWTVYVLSQPDKHIVSEQLSAGLGELSGILFFLMGAMTVVELIDVHNGFDLITAKITQTNRRKLLWIISFITFFLSPILDNLTTTIVMVSLVRKLVSNHNDRLRFTGMIVLASNAGGAWSPIGDVTTTMLWIGGQITAFNIMKVLLLPSLVCVVVPLAVLSVRMKGEITAPKETGGEKPAKLPRRVQIIVLSSGFLILMGVPVFKTVTHLPPYMGMLLGLGILWVITEILHGKRNGNDRQNLSVAYALQKIDTPSILFFLGILLSIDVLRVTGILEATAVWMSDTLVNTNVIILTMGLASSIIDNVPLVAATQGMYSLAQFPTDHYFWEFIAYSTGTGGSALIIGSAAGIAAMGMEKISFGWYLKRFTPLALLGFFAGAGVYILQHYIFN